MLENYLCTNGGSWNVSRQYRFMVTRVIVCINAGIAAENITNLIKCFEIFTRISLWPFEKYHIYTRVGIKSYDLLIFGRPSIFLKPLFLLVYNIVTAGLFHFFS